MDETRHAGNLKLVGGRLCLDFANTVDWHGSEHPQEFLLSYGDFVAWGLHVEILNEDEGKRLLEQGEDQPNEAQQVLVRAIQLRESLFRMFRAVASQEAPSEDDLGILNSILADAPTRSEVARQASGFGWTWVGADDALERMLWPVAWSAGDMLVSDDLSRVKLCPGKDCGWLFLDASRNGSRRWCAMEDCGNRAKASRHYQRIRKDKEV